MLPAPNNKQRGVPSLVAMCQRHDINQHLSHHTNTTCAHAHRGSNQGIPHILRHGTRSHLMPHIVSRCIHGETKEATNTRGTKNTSSPREAPDLLVTQAPRVPFRRPGRHNQTRVGATTSLCVTHVPSPTYSARHSSPFTAAAAATGLGERVICRRVVMLAVPSVP